MSEPVPREQAWEQALLTTGLHGRGLGPPAPFPWVTADLAGSAGRVLRKQHCARDLVRPEDTPSCHFGSFTVLGTHTLLAAKRLHPKPSGFPFDRCTEVCGYSVCSPAPPGLGQRPWLWGCPLPWRCIPNRAPKGCAQGTLVQRDSSPAFRAATEQWGFHLIADGSSSSLWIKTS